MNSFVRNIRLRKVFRVLLVVAMLCVATGSLHAQYNKAYFFWMGREHIIENRYRDAIRSLNILLGVDKDAYEGYFLRGVAKYNLDIKTCYCHFTLEGMAIRAKNTTFL